jgi:hypothetical protein
VRQDLTTEKRNYQQQKNIFVKRARNMLGLEGTSVRDLTEKQVDKLEQAIEYLRAID